MVTWPLGLTLTGLGFVGAFFSGLLGIGGAIIMVPLLLYVPPLLGVGTLSMKAVTGMTMVQVLFASLAGALVHRSSRYVHGQVVTVMGSSIVVGSLVGAFGSKYVAETMLMGTYATLAIVAAAMMFIPLREENANVAADQVDCNCLLAAILTFFVGVFAGLVGAGGAFILVPMMLYILKFPIRVTIGTSLSVVLLSAVAGVVGKVAAGQVPLVPSLVLIAGATIGARIGAVYSKKVNGQLLRWMLTALIATTAIKMWLDLLM